MPRTVVFEKWRTPREIPSSSWWRMGPFLLQQISAFLAIRCSVANLRPLGSYVHEIVNELSRWWQLKDFSFSPRKLGNDPIWLIFLGMGWNHQLDCAINNWFDEFMWVVTVRKKTTDAAFRCNDQSFRFAAVFCESKYGRPILNNESFKFSQSIS